MKGLLLTVLLALLTMVRLIFEKLAHQGDHHAVAKTQAGLKDIDVVLVIWLLIGVELAFALPFALQQMFVPEDGEGDLLAAVDGDGVAVVDQIAGELLAPDQMVHQLDVGLLDLAHIDAAQQPEQGIGMGEGFQLWKQ